MCRLVGPGAMLDGSEEKVAAVVMPQRIEVPLASVRLCERVRTWERTSAGSLHR